jgi:hypothetical protein
MDLSRIQDGCLLSNVTKPFRIKRLEYRLDFCELFNNAVSTEVSTMSNDRVNDGNETIGEAGGGGTGRDPIEGLRKPQNSGSQLYETGREI